MKTLPEKALFILIILFSIIFPSCHKEENTKNSKSATQVPDSVGDYWKYSMQSTAGVQNGFLEVRVIRQSTLADGRKVTTWIYAYPSFTDTVYKIRTDSSLDEYSVFPSTTGPNLPVMHYTFPLEQGMKWAIDPATFSDSVKVVSESLVKVPAGSFEHTFQLDFIGTRHIGNYWNNSQYWFTPNVGIIRMNYYVLNLGPDIHNGIYELVEYRLK